MNKNKINQAFAKTINAFICVVPVIVGMVLLTGLIIRFIPSEKLAGLFGGWWHTDGEVASSEISVQILECH